MQLRDSILCRNRTQKRGTPSPAKEQLEEAEMSVLILCRKLKARMAQEGEMRFLGDGGGLLTSNTSSENSLGGEVNQTRISGSIAATESSSSANRTAPPRLGLYTDSKPCMSGQFDALACLAVLDLISRRLEELQ